MGYGEIGAQLDAVYLTDDAAEVPSFAPLRLTIEAESLNLAPPMTVGTDAAASGGQYVSPTTGTDSTSPVREAWTTVNIPSAGTYYLWARLMGESSTSDALYIGFDEAWNRVFPATTGSYQWVRVEAVPGSATGVALTAGQHIIQVGHGEIGARLDALYVTDNASDSPAGSSTDPPAPPDGPCALPSGGYEGFGRHTTGGAGKPIYRVTNLNNSGAGSLRDGLAAGDRCIVFDVGGTITGTSPLTVRSNVTIDGFTAPSPGITLVDPGAHGADSGPPVLNIHSSVTTGNAVVRGLRIRGSRGDGITVFGVSNVVIDRVSVTNFGDGAIDVTAGARNVTIQWSILGQGNPEHDFVTLLSLGATRVSVHHNLYISGRDRQPSCGRGGGATSLSPELCATRATT